MLSTTIPYGQRIFHSGIPLKYPSTIRCKKLPDDICNEDIEDDGVKLECEEDDQLAFRVVQRSHASRSDVTLYHLYQRRHDFHHPAFNMGFLGQQYLIDEFLACESDRLNFIKLRHDKLRVALKTDVEDYITKHYEKKGIKVGRHVTLPGNFTGGTRYKSHLFHNCSALFTALGCPTWFITFTGNPKWPEIQENLLPGQTPYDNSPLICQVFKRKVDILIDAIKLGILGKVTAFAYTIEFQKRHATFAPSACNRCKD